MMVLNSIVVVVISIPCPFFLRLKIGPRIIGCLGPGIMLFHELIIIIVAVAVAIVASITPMITGIVTFLGTGFSAISNPTPTR